MDQTFMKQRPIIPLVIAMSVPNMLSMLVNSLYNIVDTLFVARISEDAMTALSLVFPIQNVALAIAVGFGIGTNAVIAICLGRKDQSRADAASATGLWVSAVHGVILHIACLLILPRFLRLFSDSEAVISMGVEYGKIVFLYSIPFHMGIELEKTFQSVGRMKTSMAVMMSGCIFNIIMDPVLIFGIGPFPEMGITGAALATGLSHVLTLVLYMVIYCIRPMPVHLSPRYVRIRSGNLLKIYGIGVPAALNIAMPSLLISALNSILAAYSQLYIVVLGSYYKLQTFVYLPANGIIQGIRPLVGYNFGAREYGRVRQIYRVTLCASAGIMALGMILCLCIPDRLIGLFSENPDTVAEGAVALRIICMGFVLSAFSITSCGALEGLGMGVPSLCIALMRFVILMIPMAWLLSHMIGVHGVWHAFWVTETLTAVVAVFLYRRALQRGMKKAEAEA